MPFAADVASLLSAAIASDDMAAIGACLSAVVLDSIRYEGPSDRASLVEQVTSTMNAFQVDRRIVGASLAALAHATGFALDARIPVLHIIQASKRNSSHLLIVAGAARILNDHVYAQQQQSSLAVNDEIPAIAEAASGWIVKHSADKDISHWAASILVRVASMQPEKIKIQNGQVGNWSVDCSLVKAATASLLVVNGQDWSEYIMNNLFPRHRGGRRM
jgi:hypothetical protein